MLKQGLIYLILSILVVIFAKFSYLFIVYFNMLYAYINVMLTPLFSHTGVAIATRKIILLVFLPLLIAAIPALIYRLIKGKEMPYFIELTWCLWLVLVLSNILIR